MNISIFFKSEAHYLVLEVLALRTTPAHLRQIADLSGLYVRSIELALKDLVQKKIVLRNKVKVKQVYRLDSNLPEVALIISIFQLIQKNSYQSAALDKKAQSILAFSDTSLNFLKNIKHK